MFSQVARRHQRRILIRCSTTIASTSSTSTSSIGNKEALNKKIKKILVVSKCPRYETEKNKLGLDGEHLNRELEKRGFRTEMLIESTKIHERSLNAIIRALEKAQIETRLVRHPKFEVEGEDMILSAGGDGTFLLCATKLKESGIPLLGINTDPSRSRGYFCALDVYSAIEPCLARLSIGDYHVTQRSRIKTSFSNVDSSLVPSFPYVLNEVFLAERDVSKPSVISMRLNNQPAPVFCHKSSGVIVCTGSGSTAWAMSTGRISEEQVAAILRTVGTVVTEKDLTVLTERVNKERILFDKNSDEIEYVVREPVINYEYQANNTFGRARHIVLQSLGRDTTITADGIVTCDLPAGTQVNLEISPNATLNCVHF